MDSGDEAMDSGDASWVQTCSNQLENFLEFLGVEMLKIRGVLCFVAWAAPDVLELGR